MSYLLDALRKSEYERNARQGTALAGKVVVPAVGGRARFRWLLPFVLVMLLINLGLLAWFILREPVRELVRNGDRDVAAVPAGTMENVPASPPEGELPGAANVTEPHDGAKPVAGGSGHRQLSAKQRPAETFDESPAERKRVPVAVPATNEPAAANSGSGAEYVDTPVKASRAQPQAATSELQPARPKTDVADGNNGLLSKQPERPEQSPPALRATGGNRGIPALAALPESFRRNLPSLSVNVFVHADNQAQSFVVINMNKYRAGDRLREGLLLESINPEDMVMVYEGRRFRFPRP